jgi:hypothetical protein
MARAVRQLSPVTITQRMPIWCSVATTPLQYKCSTRGQPEADRRQVSALIGKPRATFMRGPSFLLWLWPAAEQHGEPTDSRRKSASQHLPGLWFDWVHDCHHPNQHLLHSHKYAGAAAALQQQRAHRSIGLWQAAGQKVAKRSDLRAGCTTPQMMSSRRKRGGSSGSGWPPPLDLACMFLLLAAPPPLPLP